MRFFATEISCTINIHLHVLEHAHIQHFNDIEGDYPQGRDYATSFALSVNA